jgi:amino-acid N-acetyltransferase
MTLRPRTPEDLTAVTRLLETVDLTTDGLDRTEGWVIQEDGRVVGHVALERTADSAVLRSLAVDSVWRGRGLAARLMDAAEAEAGQRPVILKSETIGPWVLRRGYVPATRDQVPPGALATTQFEGALCSCCPIFLKSAADLPARSGRPGSSGG